MINLVDSLIEILLPQLEIRDFYLNFVDNLQIYQTLIEVNHVSVNCLNKEKNIIKKYVAFKIQ